MQRIGIAPYQDCELLGRLGAIAEVVSNAQLSECSQQARDSKVMGVLEQRDVRGQETVRHA